MEACVEDADLERSASIMSTCSPLSFSSPPLFEEHALAETAIRVPLIPNGQVPSSAGFGGWGACSGPMWLQAEYPLCSVAFVRDGVPDSGFRLYFNQ